MDRITEALGEEDEDVLNLKAGIDGLVFGGWSEDDIVEAVREMARASRLELAEILQSA